MQGMTFVLNPGVSGSGKGYVSMGYIAMKEQGIRVVGYTYKNGT